MYVHLRRTMYLQMHYIGNRWGHPEKIYEIFLDALILCLRKSALLTIYKIESRGQPVRGGRHRSGAGDGFPVGWWWTKDI